MLPWLSDQILKIFNYLPERFLAKSDPRFDLLRWWCLFVLIVIAAVIIGMVRGALRKGGPSTG